MSSFAQTNTGDLDISTGNLRVVQDAGQVAADKLSNLFGMGKGEWFGDTRIGVPYIQFIYVKNPNLQFISSMFDRIVRSVPEIKSVTDIRLQFFPTARSLEADIEAVSISGQAISGGLKKPFIVLNDQAGAT